MLNTIKKSFLWWIVFLWTILFWFIWYSAWTSLIADIPSQNSWDIMTSSIWNNLVTKLNKTIDNVNYLSDKTVPTWAIMAFNWTTCPTWWTAADWSWDEKNTSWVNTTLDLRWEFIRWLDSWRWVDISRVLGSNQSDMFKSHHHAQATQNWLAWNRETSNNIWQWYDYWDWYWEVPTSDVWWTETRPRNIALLYCVKL